MDENAKDVKTISFIFEALANIVLTNKLVAGKVIKETCLLQSFRHLLDVFNVWNTDVLDNVCLMIDHIVNLESLEAQDV